MNDDDFLANDFFTKIINLLEKYPSAIAGIGLPKLFDYETQEFGKIWQPRDKLGNTRSEFESGYDVVRKIFFKTTPDIKCVSESFFCFWDILYK